MSYIESYVINIVLAYMIYLTLVDSILQLLQSRRRLQLSPTESKVIQKQEVDNQLTLG